VSAAAAELPTDSPVSCIANATAFSDGIALPERAEVLASGGDLTGHFAASAMLLSTAKISPEASGPAQEEASAPVEEVIDAAESSLAEGQASTESPVPKETQSVGQSQTA